MRIPWLLLIVAVLAVSGCGEREEETAGPPEAEGKPRRLITEHIGKFRYYNPPWVDHSRWMKEEN